MRCVFGVTLTCGITELQRVCRYCRAAMLLNRFESACWLSGVDAPRGSVWATGGLRSAFGKRGVGRICFRCRGLPMVKSVQMNAVCWATCSSVPPRGRSRCDCARRCGLRRVPAMRRSLDVVSICGTLRMTNASQHRPFLQAHHGG
jgi:hypothetical protein